MIYKGDSERIIMIILKFGGSIITNKKGKSEARMNNIKEIAKTIGKMWKMGVRNIVIVHGAGSFGHPYVVENQIKDGIKSEKQRWGFAKTHLECTKLSNLFVNALLEEEVPAISIAPSAVCLMTNKKIVDFSSIVFEYLEHGYLPIVHGDMVPDSKIEGAPLSGDQIVTYLGKNARIVAVGCDVDGVIDSKGEVINRITKSNLKEVLKSIKKVDGDVTGGMEGKIRELLNLSGRSYIFNASVPKRIEEIVLGKKTVATEIIGRN